MRSKTWMMCKVQRKLKLKASNQLWDRSQERIMVQRKRVPKLLKFANLIRAMCRVMCRAMCRVMSRVMCTMSSRMM